MKTIGITGGSGFVGKRLTALLLSCGHEVVIFTRSIPGGPSKKNISYAHWNPDKEECDIAALQRLDALVHLAGAGIADKKWTAARKKEIVDSRVHSTAFLGLLLESAPRCKTFVAASAIGYYGPDRGKQAPFTETDPPYSDFLAHTCAKWEAASAKAGENRRTIILRFGIVLGKESGAFPKLSKPLSFGILPILGTGRQSVSWIEVGDLARLILFALDRDEISGIYNAVSPYAVSHGQFMKTIAQVKGGPSLHIRAPAFVLKLMLGEMAEEVLKSCTVSAQKTIDSGFDYKYPYLTGAVKAFYGIGNT
jgi:uncharacterized protein (TIGR01777 family)